MDPSSSTAPPLASPLNLAFFQNLATEQRLKADGQPSKRRGPKPDSKPAQTRRQELNRQAQRTHRERKEQYVKALEFEIQSSKIRMAEVCAERDAWLQRCSALETLLTAHGIPFHPGPPSLSPDLSASFYSGGSDMHGYHPSASSMSSPLDHSGSSSVTPTQQQVPVASPHAQFQQQPTQIQPLPQQPLAVNGIDYTQFAKDFVKSLELPCSDHQQMLCTQALDPQGNPCGHVLMATCPPREHCIHHSDVKYPHQLPNMADRDLVHLLDLSRDLPPGLLEHGEISPIEAWKILWANEAFQWLSLEDLFGIQDELMSKVRCYGYGAVLESFEVFDAIENVLSGKEPSAAMA